MATPEIINFTRGVPANESFPTDELAAAAALVLQQQSATVLSYGPAAGLASLREWIAQWQKVPVERVLTGNGSLELVEFLCTAMIKPGDFVLTEAPSYDRALTLFRRHGADLEGVTLESDGPNIEQLEKILARRVPKLFYIIPDFQNPAGATCSATKRQRIVALAEKYNFLLLEDAPYRMLRYRGSDEPTLYSMAPHRVLHMSSFTKLIAPGVRAGFMLGEPAVLAKIGKVAEDTYISPGYFAHGVTAEWCRQGKLPPQIERLKALYGPRLDACLKAIDTHMPDAVATRPNGGFFISVTLPAGTSTTALRAAATAHAVNLADGLAFFPQGGGERFLRLPFCALSAAQIDEGVRRVAAAVRDVRR
jgi:DNA-binding transcriptional MocR family regulator